VLVRLLPGNPIEVRIDQLMQQGFTYEEARNQAATLYHFDPDEPLLAQYLRYMGNLLRGDLGESITSAGTPVTQQIMRFLPWTLFSIGTALLISFTAGVLLGIMMAYWRGGILDNVVTAIASILSGIPDYVYAILIILVAGVQLQLFNVGDLRGSVSQELSAGFTLEYVLSIIKHALLPIITYVLATIGVWILSMKSSTISTLGEDYISVAKARGLPEGRILTAYVGRNAMLPLVTRLAISIGYVLGGSVIVERFFQYPGLGLQLSRAVTTRDYTTMQGIFLVITIGVVVSNILADLAMGWLDPRVSLEDK
jgi:peptide/nickel transport system permease protein